MNKFFFLLVLSLTLFSCSKGFGNKLEGEGYDVYFEFKEDEALANSLGKFWAQKDLVGKSKQSIRLTKDDEFYFIQLVASNKSQVTQMPYNELKLLFDLQNEIDSVIFKDKKSCQIVICDGSFNPIYNINQ